MSAIEVKTIIEPAALSPEHAGTYLSLTKRQIYFLLADGVLIAKRSGSRTLVDFQSVKKYYDGLPLKKIGASIANSPQVIGAGKRRKVRS
jgi:excisionase family DNA binding protein